MADAKLVPGDPTPEMVDAVCSIPVAGPYLGTDDAVDIWMAFYEAADLAAPQPAASDVPHDVVRALERTIRSVRGHFVDVLGYEPDSIMVEGLDAALNNATPAPSTSTEDALRAENARLTEAAQAVLDAETVTVHVGYDSAPGGGNFVWADAIRTDDEAFAKLRSALSR